MWLIIIYIKAYFTETSLGHSEGGFIHLASGPLSSQCTAFSSALSFANRSSGGKMLNSDWVDQVTGSLLRSFDELQSPFLTMKSWSLSPVLGPPKHPLEILLRFQDQYHLFVLHKHQFVPPLVPRNIALPKHWDTFFF